MRLLSRGVVVTREDMKVPRKDMGRCKGFVVAFQRRDVWAEPA